MDLYNRKIIAFETARRPVFELVGAMLTKALAKLAATEKPMLVRTIAFCHDRYMMPSDTCASTIVDANQ